VKLEGLLLAEAAAILGTTTTAIKLRVHKARLALERAVDGTQPERPFLRGTMRVAAMP
jgi:DNA-directed RNA polymerase specialized sigma24 family protein